MQPETRYAKSGDVHIAYQVVGDGAFDLVLVPGWVSHLEYEWEVPLYAGFLSRLAAFSRLIILDRRGTGLSDPGDRPPTLEERMDDVRAVMDCAGSERAALFGISEGGPMCILFAATYPERTSSLILYGTFAKFLKAPDFPIGHDREWVEGFLADLQSGWGRGVSAMVFGPSVIDDEEFMRAWSKLERMSVSPGRIAHLLQQTMDCDVRHILPVITVPTLVLNRTDDQATPMAGARYIAEHIPGAKLVELDGGDHFPWVDPDDILDEAEEFLTGVRHGPDLDRMLATVMFTDIAGATARATELGDRRWLALLEAHHSLVRRELNRFRGREIDNAGDGFFATFDGPARAVRCACAIRDSVESLGIAVRAGLHTGEVEVIGDKVGGIAVHIGARVEGKAEPNEVLVSSTVKDLIVGSGLDFADRGLHSLKGVPGEWHLFAALT